MRDDTFESLNSEPFCYFDLKQRAIWGDLDSRFEMFRLGFELFVVGFYAVLISNSQTGLIHLNP